MRFVYVIVHWHLRLIQWVWQKLELLTLSFDSDSNLKSSNSTHKFIKCLILLTSQERTALKNSEVSPLDEHCNSQGQQ